jgi:hypothetical protein
MKKVLISGIISICSAMIVAAIIISAGVYSTSLTSWSGSRFWYAIFSKRTYMNGIQVNLGMNLGPMFIISSILLLIGMLYLASQLFRTNE